MLYHEGLLVYLALLPWFTMLLTEWTVVFSNSVYQLQYDVIIYFIHTKKGQK